VPGIARERLQYAIAKDIGRRISTRLILMIEYVENQKNRIRLFTRLVSIISQSLSAFNHVQQRARRAILSSMQTIDKIQEVK
jgi:hypothetical protein